MIARTDQNAIVVPWDFSCHGPAELNDALRMANTSGIVHVVHVAAPLSGPDNGVLYDAAERQKRRDLEKRFREEFAGDSEWSGVRFHVVFGHPGTEIARFAEGCQASLIVVPSSTKRSISAFSSGRLAKQVVKHARRPVLVVQELEAPEGMKRSRYGFLEKLNRIWGRKPDLTNTAAFQRKQI